MGGDPILINERSATRSLKQWDRIVARCSGWLTCADQWGGVAIRTRCIGERFEVFAMLRSAPIRRSERLQSKLGRRQSSGHAAAPAMTSLWLTDIIDRAVDPPDPDMRNTEGEELMFCAMHFPLAADATADNAAW